MRRNRGGIAAIAAVILLAAGCGGQVAESSEAASAASTSGTAAPGDGGDTLRIGALYLDAQGYYAGVRAGVEQAADEAGTVIDILETTSASDAAAEASFVEQLIAGGVDAIIISAVSADASVSAIKQVHDAGVPVICYNTCINEADAEQYVDAYILGDPVRFGQMIGEAAADYFEAEGIDEPQIGITNCEFVEVCVDRRKGFEEVLSERVPGYSIVANQQATTADEAVPVAEQILTANPDLDAFWGESGGATIGAVRAVQSRDADVVVFGSDITTELADALVDGSILQATVDISGKTVGELALQATLDVLDGKTPEGAEGAGNIVQAPIVLWAGPEDGQEWIDTHPDGLP